MTLSDAQKHGVIAIEKGEWDTVRPTTLRALHRKGLFDYKAGKLTGPGYDLLYPPGRSRGKGPGGNYYYEKRAPSALRWKGPAVKTGDVVRIPSFATEAEARAHVGLTGGADHAGEPRG